MDISTAILKRESIRAYLEKPVPQDALERILESGRWAPNAGAFHVSVVRNAKLLKKINDRACEFMVHSGNAFLQQRASLPGYQPLYGAPVLILLSGPADAPFGSLNTALAAENMLLEATGLGLGSCFLISPTLALNGEGNRELAEEAGIPDSYILHCAVIVGYAAAENRFGLGERTRKGSVVFID